MLPFLPKASSQAAWNPGLFLLRLELPAVPQVGPAPGAVSLLEARGGLGKGRRSADLCVCRHLLLQTLDHTLLSGQHLAIRTKAMASLQHSRRGMESPPPLCTAPTPSPALSRVLLSAATLLCKSFLEGLLGLTPDFPNQWQIKGRARDLHFR